MAHAPDDYTFAEVDEPYRDEDGMMHWPDDTDDEPANDLDDFDDKYYDDYDDCIDDEWWGYDPEW